MECTYILNKDCKSDCDKYGIGLRACWLKKSVDDMEIIISENNPLKAAGELKPYIMSIYHLVKMGKKEPYWDRKIEDSFAEISKVITENEILSIASVKSSKYSYSYKDTKKKAEKEIKKLKNKIEEIKPQLDYFLEIKF